METTPIRKISLTKRILDVEDDTILDKIEAILAETEIVAYTTTTGSPLTKAEYAKRLENISNSISEGAKTYTSNEIRKTVLNRK